MTNKTTVEADWSATQTDETAEATPTASRRLSDDDSAMIDTNNPMLFTIAFLATLGIVWGFVKTASDDPNVDTSYVAIVALIGGIYTLGGIAWIWKLFEKKIGSGAK